LFGICLVFLKRSNKMLAGSDDASASLLFNHCHADLLVGRTTPNYMQNHRGKIFDLKSSRYKLDFYQPNLFRRLNSIFGKLVPA
jgi:hypothetical protein